ncbi:MAG: hypothetical protein ACJ748_03535 [Flavisolibacter sp.]
MLEEFQEEQMKQGRRTRAIVDYVMGVLWLLIGAYLLIFRKVELNIKILSVLFILYGCWRIYRGYKKNYYR